MNALSLAGEPQENVSMSLDRSLRERLADFVEESLRIEGIMRLPTIRELEATEDFLTADLTLLSVCTLQNSLAPDKPLRVQHGANVRVGNYHAPPGGPQIRDLLTRCLDIADPWDCHVEFELLHPFMDGNGRTGRAIWAWKMMRAGQDPFALPFLHRFYYQTLERAP